MKDELPIILTKLTSHVRILADMLQPHANHVISLVGADSTKEKRIAMERLGQIPTSESLIIVATGNYIGEGFDYPPQFLSSETPLCVELRSLIAWKDHYIAVAFSPTLRTMRSQVGLE